MPQQRDRFGLRVIEVEESGWGDEPDTSVLQRNLKELGLDESVIEQSVREAHKSLGDPTGKAYLSWDDDQIREARFRLTSFVEHLFDTLLSETIVVATERKRIRIPLFYVSAPAHGKSRVVYKDVTAKETGPTWTVKVVGVGLGRKKTFALKESEEFEVKAGDEKVVFVPGTMLVSRRVTRRGDRQIGQGISYELESPQTGPLDSDAVAIVPANDRSDAAASSPLFLYEFQDDKAGDIAKKEYEVASKSEWTVSGEIGLDVFKSSVKVETGVKRERKIALAFEFEGGRQYELRALNARDGICWRLP